MRGTGIGTSLMLIAIGAILAFATNVRSTALDLNAIGAILMVIGIFGILLSFVILGDEGLWGFGRYVHLRRREYFEDDYPVPPHEHRRVETKDVIYEEEPHADRVERERRIHT